MLRFQPHRAKAMRDGLPAGTVLISLAAMAAASPRLLVSPAPIDRKFYTGMAILMMFTALFGFSRTYFLGLISGHPTTITVRVPNATVHLPAPLFMSWLMILASSSLMSAALVRWPGVLAVGPLLAYGLTLLFPIAGGVYDRWSRGRVHPVYRWGLAVIVLGVGVRVALLGSPAWAHAMQSLFG